MSKAKTETLTFQMLKDKSKEVLPCTWYRDRIHGHPGHKDLTNNLYGVARTYKTHHVIKRFVARW